MEFLRYILYVQDLLPGGLFLYVSGLSLIGVALAQGLSYIIYIACSWQRLSVILMVRTWVVWNSNRVIGALLIFLVSGLFISASVWIGLFTSHIAGEFFLDSSSFWMTEISYFLDAVEAPPFPGYQGCFIVGTGTSASSLPNISFYAMTVVDSGELCFGFSPISGCRHN